MSHIEDCRCEDYFRERRTDHNEIQRYELACPCEHDKRHEKAFECGKPCSFTKNAARDGTRNIAHRDRSACSESVSETCGDRNIIAVCCCLHCVH